MSDTNTKPRIFLAFANDRDDTVGYLRNLPDEARRPREARQPAVQSGLYEVEVRSNCTAEDIRKVFRNPEYRNRVAIFHYGGYANGYPFYLGLASGANVRSAYNEAVAAAKTAKGGNPRTLYFGRTGGVQNQPEADRWPWNLSLREGAESIDQWSLPQAVDNPLFGLPPLPDQYLPDSPYRHLNWFTRKDAEVFFGRGHQIHELYDRNDDK